MEFEIKERKRRERREKISFFSFNSRKYNITLILNIINRIGFPINAVPC
jgi:hypothetical protein